MKRRILSLLLAACIAASLLTLPAGAATATATGFNDIDNRATAVAAECLRLLGAMDGYAGGAFRPEGQVTRAQFCKMATFVIEDGESQLSRYRTVTVFPDVKPSHWAAAYINLASDSKRGSVGDDKTDHSIIKGFMDGKFHPERVVTVGQAVTILMRLLGYTDADMGGIWPDGYMAAAATAGLTDGITAPASGPLTRGEAARLFVNLLRSDTKGKENYGRTIADDMVEGEMLITSSAAGPDGRDTGMQLSGETKTYAMAGDKASTGALNGMKGALLLKAGKVMTFVPEISGSSRTVTAAAAEATKLTITSGESFAIEGSTKMAKADGASTTWAEGYASVYPGMSLTLYIGGSGTIEYVILASGSTSSAAVVVYANGSTAGFSGLTGGNTRYSIYKDGAAAAAGDMRPYDVATYSPATNSIRVSDARITGVYEDAKPNLSNPTEITVMGYPFKVLPTAADTMSKLKLGDVITLLLTEDAQVAGAVPAGTSGAAGNAVGFVQAGVSETHAKVSLLCGVTVEGTVALSKLEADRMEGQLVSVSSDRRGQLGLARLTGSVFGDLDVSARKMGPKLLAENVSVYQTTAGKPEAVSLSQIPSSRIPSSGVVYARTNWAGKVDLIILSNVTGSDYRFGRLHYIMGEETPVYDDDELVDTKRAPDKLSVITGNGTQLGPFSIGHFTVVDDKEAHDGDYVGVILNKQETLIETILVLSKYGNVANSAWSSAFSVTIGGRSYTVPSDVLCYNKSSGKWIENSEGKQDKLDKARAFAASSTVYIDQSGFVRVVEVQ